MKASKQHFELVQRVIRNARDTVVFDARLTAISRGASIELLDSLSRDFADAFARSNKSGFDRARFLTGCGVHLQPLLTDDSSNFDKELRAEERRGHPKGFK